MSVVETLESLLHRHWGIVQARLQLLSSGHTNKSYLVHCDSRVAVLRVSWPGKSVEQVRCEKSALDYVASAPHLPALPRLQPTVTAQPYIQTADGSWLHLFEHIPGSPGLLDDAQRGVVDAMRTLAHLHAAMATIPASESSPLAWLNTRYARVAARPAPPLPALLLEQYDLLLQHIGAHLGAAAARGVWTTEPVRWLHGDYHAGNLLFIDGNVRGILDFDDVGQGAHGLEAAFALFALSRDTTVEDRFVYDIGLWDMGLRTYAETQPDTTASDRMHENRDALMYLFCADQVLIHLEAAQRHLWMPGPGMGFLGCWWQLQSDIPRGL
ncbi:Ser/Thr protein kinase RdoA involved in Cpx stress response, MazF antagonist [Paraburkholderia megapolitana]|uniref:Ser/Thr protein kinase RdoA involved in Cpx stress response, MazF antagonist n=1 Tax=Paraburkholderia megapolitana TaxID=420953 RepID=A0A1I3KRU4_9BURK|nr:Ser/Thr protein kinase RdoA involved in Cpx stress response, MazF antagonist [Paraburkholderia megapolitana]